MLGGVPPWLSLVADAMVLGGLLLTFWVMKVNSFASRTIEVEAGQKVVSSGPYGLVRHPLYSGSLLIWLFAPVALGSYAAWPAFALLVPLYVYRLLNEEKFLRRALPGYSEYCLRTRFRLVPYIF
jgi:protein-S-isoprenylcysteine O-methyltransferase Ste14